MNTPADTVVRREYVDVCGVDDLWDGEMETFEVKGRQVLIVKHGGEIMAYDAVCPHQSVSLGEGELTEDGVIICRAHRWQFRAACGSGINPSSARLMRYEVNVEGGRVRVADPASVEEGRP